MVPLHLLCFFLIPSHQHLHFLEEALDLSCKCMGMLAKDMIGTSDGNAAAMCSTLKEFDATSNTIVVGMASNDTMYLLQLVACRMMPYNHLHFYHLLPSSINSTTAPDTLVCG